MIGFLFEFLHLSDFYEYLHLGLFLKLLARKTSFKFKKFFLLVPLACFLLPWEQALRVQILHFNSLTTLFLFSLHNDMENGLANS